MPDRPPEPMPTLPPAVARSIDRLTAHQMALPCLLFAASHRPLAFGIGQILLLFEGYGFLGKSEWLRAWAGTLSSPRGMDLVESRLRAASGHDTQRKETA